MALLDEKGRVLFANRRAEAIFRDGGGPTVVNQRLSAADVHDACQIKEALRRAAQGLGDSVRLTDPAGGRQWIVTFSPLRIPSPQAPDAARILLLIATPGVAPTAGLTHFAKLYRLTPAETRVLEQLLQQENTRDIAETLSITMPTLRIHLAKLFAKTDTANQRELVRFYLAHPALPQD